MAVVGVIEDELYGQGEEVRLLAALLPHLENRSLIDVGAERGGFAQAMLDGGIERLYAFEPEPENVTELRSRFADDPRVVIDSHALSNKNGRRELRRSRDPTGARITFGHTFLERPDSAEIAWGDPVSVEARTLGSLVRSGVIPRHVGILKVDTEGHDLAVIEGMGELDCDVVMVEHWLDLPNSLGPCPWRPEQIDSALKPRGFAHFAFVHHRAEFVILKWDDHEVEPGYMGNLVFLHERLLPEAALGILDSATRLAVAAAEVGEMYMRVARRRLAIIEHLRAAANKRLAMIKELRAAADERMGVIEELKAAADERLGVIEDLRAAADERLGVIEDLRRRLRS
jgi:FkbM family methyltransferase